jgi:hypothetical protein
MSHSDRLFLIPILQRERCRAAADAPRVRAAGGPPFPFLVFDNQ